MKNDDEDRVLYDLDSKLVQTTTVTCQQLLKMSDDAFTLYLFYVYTSRWQNNVRPKATDTYCMEGLKWGTTRFYKAKKLLTSKGYIEQVQTKTEGRMGSTYINIHYLPRSNRFRSPSEPQSGKRETNTLEYKEIPKNTATPIVWEEYLDSMLKDKQKHIQIIGFFFKTKELTFDTKEKVEVAIRRHLKPARELAAFDKKELGEMIRKLNYEFPKFTLETVLKYLTK